MSATRSTPSKTAEPVHVAVAVIFNARQQVLLTQRHVDSHQGGLWEFPGGKLELGESLEQALGRELQEELGIVVREHHAFLSIEHDYADKRVLLDVQCVTTFEGTPAACEGQPMRWVNVADLPDYAFPKANAAIVTALVQGQR